MIKIIKKVINIFVPKDSRLHNFLWSLRKRPVSQFFDIGFHGDKHLIDFACGVISSCQQFIETGTSVGSTLRFVAEKFPNIKLYGCEPDGNAFDFALGKISNYNNVTLKRRTSPDFLYELVKNNQGILSKDTVFWLDSHDHGFKWPLRDEVGFITSKFTKGYIFIDDFLVPDEPQFGYDSFDGQTCSMDYIQEYLNKDKRYRIVYPSYDDKTSNFCSLRGWVLIEFGHEGDIPMITPGETIELFIPSLA